MKKQLLETLEKARRYTFAVAEMMPEKAYTFKPEGAAWNFAELLNHTGYGIQWWKTNYLMGTETAWQPPVLKHAKKAVLKYLTQVFQDLEATCTQLPLNTEAQIQGFHATLDHLTHHRGQAVIYLRCQGFTPPEYIY